MPNEGEAIRFKISFHKCNKIIYTNLKVSTYNVSIHGQSIPIHLHKYLHNEDIV